MPDCIFCAIAAGAAPASVVHADEDVIAFMDIRPAAPGHVLVIPRVHAVGLADLPEDLGGPVMRTAQRVAAAIRASDVRADGINLLLADGVAAGQEVFHLHLHVIPRFAGDRVTMTADFSSPPDRAQLDAQAAALGAALPAPA